MPKDGESPFSGYSDDDLVEYIEVFHSLGRHRGYQDLMGELQRQYGQLSERLLRSSDIMEIARTQGAMRAIADLLEPSPTASESLRQRMMSEIEYELQVRKEGELNG